MARMARADVEQLYGRGLLLYKGELVHVREAHGYDVNIYNLKTKKLSLVDFQQEHFKPLKNRIGMVNIGMSVVNIRRTTARQYAIGLTMENCTIEGCEGAPYPKGGGVYMGLLKKFEAPEILSAYNNEYPTLQIAYDRAITWEGCCAFDKQFAVDCKGHVYYTTKRVGTYTSGVLSFYDGYEYLNCLLENGYEKGTRTFKATPLRR